MTVFSRAWRGGRNDWRLHALSIFSVAVGFVCLTAAALVVVNVDGVRQRWAASGRASVYLKPEATTEQIRAIVRALERTQGVSRVRHLTSDDARRELADGRDDELLAGLPAEAFPASLEIALEDEAAAARLDKLSNQLRTLPAVEAVETYAAWSDRLGVLLAGGVTAALVLSVIVLGAVVSIVSSTIRLVLQRRRVEIEVLKLVGATDSYVRSPFLIEGAAQGGFGAALALAMVGVLYLIVREHFDQQLLATIGMTPTFLPLPLATCCVLLGAALGTVAAYASLRKLLVV